MNKFKLLALFLCVGIFSYAQIRTPQPSPSSKLEQSVGLTEITVKYSRPSKKERTVFGDLVPYDKIWRTGANENTTITFSENVTIGGTDVKKGTYAIFTKPSAKSWEVYFYSDTNNWGAPQDFNMSKVVAKATAPVMEIPFEIETFTIDISNISNNGADLEFFWSNVYVALPIKVNTKEQTLASIEKTLTGVSSRDYYSAATYYYQEDLDINKAKTWIDKAVEIDGDQAAFWMLRAKSLIYAKAGDKKGAIAAAKLSLEKAKQANNQDYVKMNEDSLKEWGAK